MGGGSAARLGSSRQQPLASQLQGQGQQWPAGHCQPTTGPHIRHTASLIASFSSTPTLLQVLTAILQSAKLPGVEIDPRDSGANVKASALVRMDEQLTQFAVSETF